MSTDVSVFTYADIEDDDVGKLRYYAGEIGKATDNARDAVLSAGKCLAEAQEILSEYGHGSFQKWVESETAYSKRTAYNMIDAHTAFGGDCATVAQLEISAMYVLAKNEPAKKKALKMASKGETITQAKAKQIVKQLKAATPSKPKSSGGNASTDPDATKETTSSGKDSGKDSGSKDAAASKGEAGSVVLDSLDRPIPKCFLPANELAAEIQTEGRKLDAILRRLKELADNPGGEFLETSLLEDEFKALKSRVFGACYWSECPRCEGEIGKSCRECSGRGWWPQRKHGHLSAADKTWLGV